MAIKLDIYLRRTQQSLSDWMCANGISEVSDFLPRCAYLGLSASPADVVAATEVLRSAAAQPQPTSQQPVLPPADHVVEKKQPKQRKKRVNETDTDPVG